MIYNKRNLLFVFSAMLSLFLVACGGADGGADSVDLSQSFSFDSEMGGSATISYPEGWVAEVGEGSANFASNEELLAIAADTDTPEVPAGEGIALAIVIPAEFASFFTNEGEDPSATAIANSFVTDFATGEDVEVGEVEEITISDTSGAIVEATADDTTLVIVVVEVGEGNYALILGAGASADDIRPTVEAMAGTVEYTPGETE